jgi:glycosyltransferase involved in cell wall biosynthesis
MMDSDPLLSVFKGKKILYVYQHDYPWEVRIEKIVSSLIGVGCEVMVLSRWNGIKPTEYDNDGEVKVKRVGFGKNRRLFEPTSFNPLWRQAIQTAIDEFKPDLIIPREILLAEACIAVARKKNIPVVMDMAEHYPAAMKGWDKYYNNLLLRAVVHWLDVPTMVEKRSVLGCDGVITCAIENSQRLESEYGYPMDKQCLVHNTSPLSKFSEVRKGIIHERDNLVFSHYGYITPVRNLITSINGFGLLDMDELKNTSLLIAGNSEKDIADEIAECRKSNPNKDFIKITGAYKEYELAALFSNCDLGIIPYVPNDCMNNTIPNKLFDNLACGKPMMVSLSPPLKRMVEETGSGIAVDCSNPISVADGIRRMLKADLEQMSFNALKAAENLYNWSVDEKRMLNFLKRFI